MQPRSDRLDVYYGSDRVGAVHDSAPLAFEYAPAWLGSSLRMSLAAIPLQAGRQATPEVQAFFENLLPEGELRDYLAAQRKASTLFSLLLEVAGDTAGAFVLVAPGQTPVPPATRPRPGRPSPRSWPSGRLQRSTSTEQGARISLAGAQDKTSLAIFDDGVPRLPKGTSPSTHILKPNIRRLAKVWHSAANETIVMRAAALAGLPTAEVFYEPHAKPASCAASTASFAPTARWPGWCSTTCASWPARCRTASTRRKAARAWPPAPN
jgi:serine/threonine-protein kinase HipA